MRNWWSCTRKKGWRNATEKINLTLLILIYPRDAEDGDLKEKKAARAVGAACSTAGCVVAEVSRCRGRPLGAPISCLLADESKQKAPAMGQETRSWGALKVAWPACCWQGVECQGEQGRWAQEDFPRLYWDVAARTAGTRNDAWLSESKMSNLDISGPHRNTDPTLSGQNAASLECNRRTKRSFSMSVEKNASLLMKSDKKVVSGQDGKP